jgi:hypothetical protein
MAVVRYQKLDLASRSRRWDGDAAEDRVRRWAGAGDGPNDKYRSAFLWYDDEAPDRFGSYKFPVADVVRGSLKAIPRAVISAAGIVDGARGGASIPQKDIPALKRHIARYYEQMGETPPWSRAKADAKPAKGDAKPAKGPGRSKAKKAAK